MPRLLDKTVLVTGASAGIGRAIAVGCAREGADLVLNYYDDPSGTKVTAQEVERLGRRAVVVRADLRQVGQIQKMFARARKAFPRLDVLVNNAGLTGWASFFETTEEKWDVVLDTNLK